MSKILIIDDDKDISELVSLILKKENIDSDIINNPIDALKLLENGTNEYNLILLDIMMPELSGTELCSKVREKVEVPIIFLSAKKELIDKMLGYEIGGDDYYIDLLFYHLKLKCYVVIELKTVEFQPEFARKIKFLFI